MKGRWVEVPERTLWGRLLVRLGLRRPQRAFVPDHPVGLLWRAEGGERETRSL